MPLAIPLFIENLIDRPLGLAAGPSFADQIQIRCGDVRVLGRYFLHAERALADMGLTLRIVDGAEILRIFDANSDTWAAVGPPFNPRQSRFAPDDVLMFAAYTDAGQAVAACCVRYFDLGHETLTEAVNSRRFLYGERATEIADRIACELTAPAGTSLTGPIILSGGQWVHPSFRGSGLAQIIVLVPRAYGLSQWHVEHEMLFAKDHLAKPQNIKKYGLPHIQDGLKIFLDGTVWWKGLLFWSSADHLAGLIAAEVQAFQGTRLNDSRDRDQVSVTR